MCHAPCPVPGEETSWGSTSFTPLLLHFPWGREEELECCGGGRRRAAPSTSAGGLFPAVRLLSV